MVWRSTVLSTLVLLALMAGPGSAHAQEAATHTVVRGETLWDLSRTYYGNPFEWRTIYEANRDVIENPHWIYPGEVLTIPDAGARVTGVEVEGGEPRMPAPPRDRAPCPGADERTVFYSGMGPEAQRDCPVNPGERRTIFFPTGDDAGGPTVVGLADRPWMAVPRDIFYSAGWVTSLQDEVPHMGRIMRLRREGSGIGERTTAHPYERLQVIVAQGPRPAVGDLLQTFRVNGTIPDVGRVAVPTGLLTVNEVTDSGVVATVSVEYARVQVGDLVRMAPPFDLEPALGAEPTDGGVTGTLLGFQQDLELQQLGNVAFLNVGAEQGVRLGDEFVAYSREPEGWPSEVAGRLQVVGVRPGRSAVRVVHISSPSFRPGMRVRMVARLP